MPYDYLIPLILGAIVLLAVCLSVKPSKQLFLGFALILAAISATRIDGVMKPFYGLEYEDAYVWQAVTKDISYHDSKASPFRIQLADLDLESGYESTHSFNGHFTSFSSWVLLFNRLFGYSAENVILVNTVFSVLIYLLLFTIVFTVSNNLLLSMFATLLAVATPAINVFHSAGMSETYSSLIILSSIFLYIKYTHLSSKNRYSASILILLFISIITGILIKRENLLLLLLVAPASPRIYKNRHAAWLISLAVFMAFIFIYVRPFHTEYLESEFIGASTFSFDYLLIQLPVYLKTIYSIKYFGLTTWIVTLLTIFQLIRRKGALSTTASALCILFIGYLLLYSLHYRGQYFIESRSITSFETFRYLNNFYIILLPLMGLLIMDEIQIRSHSKLLTAGVFLFGLTVWGNFSSIKFRNKLHTIEQQNRLENVNFCIQSLYDFSNSILVSDVAIAIKMYDYGGLIVSEYKSNTNYADLNFSGLYFLLSSNLIERHSHNCQLDKYPLKQESNQKYFHLYDCQ